MTELKSCPFCGIKNPQGGLVRVTEHRDGCFLRILLEASKGVDVVGMYGADYLDRSWNTRHIPEGYALVPVEPTDEMVKVGVFAHPDPIGRALENQYMATIRAKYKAMLKAAQEPAA